MALQFKSCSVEGCKTNAHHSRSGSLGFCPNHAARFRRHGDPLGGRVPNGTLMTCKLDGCSKSARRVDHGCKGYCSDHYNRWRFHGDPLGGRVPFGGPLRWIQDNAAHQGDNCLIWPFEKTRHGYGTVKYHGRKCVASRIMCIVAHGEPPTPKHDAVHSCGNGHLACMNQNHLHWGTRTENMQDAVAQGTNVRGAQISPLTEIDVMEIRSIGNGLFQYEIAELYGVKQAAISRILNRKAWGWLKEVAASSVTVDRSLSAGQWSNIVCARDGFRCQCCGAENRDDLDAHHIESHCQNKKDRINPDNGITLCKGCHIGFHHKYGNRDFGREQLNDYLAGYDGRNLHCAS